MVPSRSKTTSRTLARSGSPAGGRELPQHVLQNAAVTVVLLLLRGIDAHARLEPSHAAVGRAGGHFDRLGDPALETRNLVELLAAQAEILGVLSVGELQR